MTPGEDAGVLSSAWEANGWWRCDTLLIWSGSTVASVNVASGRQSNLSGTYYEVVYQGIAMQ